MKKIAYYAAMFIVAAVLATEIYPMIERGVDDWCVKNAPVNPIAQSEVCDGNQCRIR